MKVSLIIAVYNEADHVVECLESLTKQTLEAQIIIVDDGSTDSTGRLISDFAIKHKNIQILKLFHLGPAAARNSGSEIATGEILVFVDGDMIFDQNFLKELIRPIRDHESRGTFTKKEYVANWDNVWSKCWNFNQNLPDNRRIPKNYPDEAPVFRAILTSEFLRVRGFTEDVGWTDDWSISRKIGYQATATDAICYHYNPQNLCEIFVQSQWIGKNEFISGDFIKTIISLLKYSLPVSIFLGIIKTIKYRYIEFFVFKLVYDFGIIYGMSKKILIGSKNK